MHDHITHHCRNFYIAIGWNKACSCRLSMQHISPAHLVVEQFADDVEDKCTCWVDPPWIRLHGSPGSVLLAGCPASCALRCVMTQLEHSSWGGSRDVLVQCARRSVLSFWLVCSASAQLAAYGPCKCTKSTVAAFSGPGQVTPAFDRGRAVRSARSLKRSHDLSASTVGISLSWALSSIYSLWLYSHVPMHMIATKAALRAWLKVQQILPM